MLTQNIQERTHEHTRYTHAHRSRAIIMQFKWISAMDDTDSLNVNDHQ